FQNIVLRPQFVLPGVFDDHPRAGIVNGSLWTISLEMTCYALIAAISLAFKGRALTIALCVLAVCLLFPRLPFLGLVLAWFAAKPLPLAFCLGALFYRFAGRVPLNGYVSLAGIGFAVLLAWAGSTWAIFPLTYAVVWFGSRVLPCVQLPGDYSYGTYLTAYP